MAGGLLQALHAVVAEPPGWVRPSRRAKDLLAHRVVDAGADTGGRRATDLAQS